MREPGRKDTFDRKPPGRIVSTRTNLRIRGALITGISALWIWKKMTASPHPEEDRTRMRAEACRERSVSAATRAHVTSSMARWDWRRD